MAVPDHDDLARVCTVNSTREEQWVAQHITADVFQHYCIDWLYGDASVQPHDLELLDQICNWICYASGQVR